MEKEIDAVKEKFIETIGNIGEGLGFNRTICQIYALLYITSKPLSPTEISRELGVSKGNVSINLKKLEEWNAIKKVWRKGYARSLYEANRDVEEIIFQKLKIGLGKRITQINQTIEEIKKKLKNSTQDKEISYIKKRISEIEKIVGKITTLVKNLDHIRSLMK